MKFATKPIDRPVIKIISRIPLLNFAIMHDPDLVRDRERFILIMGHQYRRSILALEDFAYFQAQAFAQAHIQIGKRFVQITARAAGPARGQAPRAVADPRTVHGDTYLDEESVSPQFAAISATRARAPVFGF